MQRKGRRYKSRWTKKVGIKQVRRLGVCEVCLYNFIETDLIVKKGEYIVCITCISNRLNMDVKVIKAVYHA